MTTATLSRDQEVATRRTLPRLATPSLPASVEAAPAAIARPASAYEELRTRAAAAIEAAFELERRRPEAERADLEAHAQALRDGKGDSGTPRTDALRAEIEAARREATALVSASRDAWSELLPALVEHADAWREALDAKAAKAAKSAATALDKAEQVIGEIAEVRATLRYVQDAQSAAAGERLRGGAMPRRFPGREQSPSARTTWGSASYEVGQLIGVVRDWLAGEPAS